MNTKDPRSNNSSQRKTIETISKSLPHFEIHPSFAYTMMEKYINQRTRRSCWPLNTNDCLWGGKSCFDTSPCMQVANRYIPRIVVHDPHNPPRTNNSALPLDSLSSSTCISGLQIAHGNPHRHWREVLVQATWARV